jgi:hypothetical protein
VRAWREVRRVRRTDGSYDEFNAVEVFDFAACARAWGIANGVYGDVNVAAEGALEESDEHDSRER